MKISIQIIILLFCGFCYSQQNNKEIDSLKVLVNSENIDSVKVRLLLKLEYAYRYTDYKEGLRHAMQALEIAKKNKWEKGLALCYNNIGNNYLDRDEYVEALKNYKNSLDYSENYPKIKILTLTNVSNIYLRGKDFKLSHKYINDAATIALKLKDDVEIAYCYYQIGLIFRDENKVEDAKANFKKSLKLFSTDKNIFEIAEVTSFLAQVEDSYGLKIKYLLQSKSIWDKLAPGYISAVTNSNLLAETYVQIYENDSIKRISGISLSKSQLLKDADKILTESLKYSTVAGNKQNLMDAYKTLTRIKFLENDFANAYKFSNLNQILHDSVFSQESKNKIAAIESQKEIDLRDSKIKTNQVKLQLKQKQNYLLLISIGSLILIGFLLFLQSKSRKRNNDKLKALNAELDVANKSKVKLLGILNHDLRSPVVNFIHYIQFKKESNSALDQETRNRIENATLNSARNLLYSMEDILQWSKSQMENFTAVPTIVSANKLFEDIKNHFSSFEKITISVDDSEDCALLTDEDYLKTILRNLCGNAVKALEDRDNPEIVLRCIKLQQHTVLIISDNGSGADLEQFESLYENRTQLGVRTGLGFHLIRDLAKAINCQIIVETKKAVGTTFRLTFQV